MNTSNRIRKLEERMAELEAELQRRPVQFISYPPENYGRCGCGAPLLSVHDCVVSWRRAPYGGIPVPDSGTSWYVGMLSGNVWASIGTTTGTFANEVPV